MTSFLLCSSLIWPVVAPAEMDPGSSAPTPSHKTNTPLSEFPTGGPAKESPPLRTEGGAIEAPAPGPHPADPLAEQGGGQAQPIGLAVTPEEFAVANPNFEGIDTNGQPPDTNGAVGPSHYIQIVNASSFQIWDKEGNALTGAINMQQLWIDAGAPANDDCRVRGRGDPYVVYDNLADRWVLTQFANKGTDVDDPLNIQCIAVSAGPDPVNDDWYVYTFDLGFYNDYPKLAVWPDGYYLVSQRGYNGNAVDVTVFDRATMLNGGAATFQTRTGSGGAPTIIMLPSELEGTPPAPGTPNYYVRMIDCDLFANQGPCPANPNNSSDRIEVREFQVDWGNPANTTFGNLQALSPADFSSDICDGANLFNDCIDQPGAGTTDKEALSVWPMAPANYRNFGSYESLVFNHTVDVDGNGLAGIRWYELRRSGGAWSIYQQGTYSPPDGTDTHRWMGSIGMDKAGNIALGYSVSNNTNVYPGIRYTGRLATDPLGLLPQGEFTLVDGSTSTGGTRWGDYSAMRVDPVDGCTFWYTTEFNDVDGQTTRIGAFRFPSCNPVDLAISKSARPDPAAAGAQLFYDVTVENLGPSLATDVVVTDNLPTGVEYVTDTDNCVEGPVGTLTCELDDLDAGASTTFTIKVLVDADLVVLSGPTTITNTASVTSDEEDTDPSNNETSISTIVEDSADLKIAKLCKPDRPLLAGETAICEIFVDNLGSSDARNVRVEDAHVSEGDFTISSAVSTQGGCVISGGDVTCNLGALPASDTDNRATINIELMAVEAVDINDTAIVSSDTPDPDTSNNMAMGSISVSALANLALSKSDSPDPVIAGEELTYDLTVTNNGPSTAVNVLIEDILPAGTSVVSVVAPGGSCNAGVPGDSTQPTTCTFNSLASLTNGSMTIVVSVLPDTSGILHNDAKVSSGTFDNDNSDNLASTDTQVDSEADLVVTKADSPDPVLAGAPLTYTIEVTNQGPSTALDVMLTDTLPPEVSLDSAVIQNDGPCDLVESDSFECNLGALDPWQTVTVYAQVTVDASVPDGTSITNIVNVSSSTPDGNAGNNEASATTLVNAAADLWIDKTSNFPTGNASGTILYFLTVYNEPGCSEDDPQVCGDGGPSDALDVVVTDTLPSTSKKLEVQFVSENCTYDEGTHTVACQEPVLQVGSSVTFEIQARAKGNLGEINNLVDVASSTSDPDLGNNHDELLLTVQGGTGNPGGPKNGRGRSGK